MNKEVDVSVLLRSGVYILSWRGRVVYVGQAKELLTRIYTHRCLRRQQIAGRKMTEKTRLRPIMFDKVEVIPLALSDLGRVERELIAKYRPEYNTAHLPKLSLESIIGNRFKPQQIKFERRI